MFLCKTHPGPIWMAWSGFGQTHLVQKQAGVQESSGSYFWQDTTGPLPVSNFQTRFRSSADVPDNILQNQPGSDFVLADCVRFWAKRIRSGSKPVSKNHPARSWPMPPFRSGPDPACLLGINSESDQSINVLLSCLLKATLETNKQFKTNLYFL